MKLKNSSTVKTGKPSISRKPSSKPKTAMTDNAKAKTGLVQLKIELKETNLKRTIIIPEDGSMSSRAWPNRSSTPHAAAIGRAQWA